MSKAYALTHEAQLRNFTQLVVDVEQEYGLVWLYQCPEPRACFNWQLVDELRTVQTILEINGGYLPVKGNMVKVNFIVLDSLIPNVFSMGGDLNLFHQCITNKNSHRLMKYAKLCIDTIHGFIVGCRLPIKTISLVRGDAMGGGFEVALSCQVMIAEKNIEMGFPEVLFNLFPGMGGYHLLSQRLPVKQVEKIMLSGTKYRSEVLYDMGVIDHIVKPGEGKQAVYQYIKESIKYANSHHAMKNVREKVHPVSHEDLMDICKYWVETAMNLTERDLKLMERLVRAQTRKAESRYDDDKIAEISA